MKSPVALYANHHFFAFLCAVLATSALIISVGPVAAQTKIVYGANNPAVDVPAVQNAVDQGGTVILRGTFNFGNDEGNHIIVPGRTGAAQDVKGKSTVFIYKNNVTILGIRDAKGNLLTIVKNGMPPFWIGWDGNVTRTQPAGTEGMDYGVESFPQDQAGLVQYRDGYTDPGYANAQTRYALPFPNVSATIKNIYFDSPKHYGVKATAGQNITVIGNVFRDVQFGGLVNVNGLGGATHIAVAAVGGGFLYPPFIYPAITGKIDMENNVVEEVGIETIDTTHAGECFGLAALATNAIVTMKENKVRNIGRREDGTFPDVIYTGGMLLIDNYGGSPLVSGNIVRNSLFFGIWDYVVFAPTPGPTIAGNTFIDCGVSAVQTQSDFRTAREGAKIDTNFIFQTGQLGTGGSAITAMNVSGAMMRWNTFVGSYSVPLVALLGASNCTLLMNWDTRRIIPSEAPTYFLDTNSSFNLIKGLTGTANDKGGNNTIILPK